VLSIFIKSLFRETWVYRVLARWQEARFQKSARKKSYSSELLEMKLEFYSSSSFSFSKFQNISDREASVNKPEGGLWTCPIESESNWRDYKCFLKPCNVRTSLDFKGNVLIIDSFEDSKSKLFWRRDPRRFHSELMPLFEPLLEEGVDAIWLTEKGRKETDLMAPYCLFWELESFLVLNPKSITLCNSYCELNHEP